MRLSYFDYVSALKIDLERLTALFEAAEQGCLHLTSNYNGSSFDFDTVLPSDVAYDVARGTLKSLIGAKMEIVRGKLRQYGVDPDA